MENICIFGASSNTDNENLNSTAYTLGKYIVQNGYGFVFGGGNTGLMGRAACGAYDNNGYIIGIAPEFMNVPGALFQNCDELILTPTMHIRTETMEMMSSSFVCLPGGFGTLDEIFEIITFKILGLHNKAVVILNVDNFFESMLKQINEAANKGFLPKEYLSSFSVAETPMQVIDCLDNYQYREIKPKRICFKEE